MTTNKPKKTAGMALAWVFVFSFSAAGAQSESRCASCHFSRPDSPNSSHLSDWDRSPHGRSGVGCEKCHGGNAETFEPFQAHLGILNSRNPASPVHRLQLPRTCGSCHIGPFVAFQDSRHYQLLQEGNERTPVCSTCHGEVGAYLPSVRTLQQRCAGCHGPGREAERPEYPSQAATTLQTIMTIRESVRAAESITGRVRDPEKKRALEYALEQARVPLTEAVGAAHSFQFQESEALLERARRRVEAILSQLAGESN